MSNAPKRPGPRRNDAPRMAFISRKSEIEEALKRGDYASTIFERIGFPGSYSQFARLIARHLPKARLSGPEPVPAALPTPPPATPAPSIAGPSEPPTGAGPRRVARKEPTPWDPSNLDSAELFGTRTEK